MYTAPTWRIDHQKILTRTELTTVLEDLSQRAPRSASARMNRVLFRLACCCGLRVSEISMLTLEDCRTSWNRPHLRMRKEATKGHRARTVPLWWDAGTLADIDAWKQERKEQDATERDPLVCSLKPTTFGEPLGRHTLRRRFRTACWVLGRERLTGLTIHHGRHTFVSHALAGGRSLAEVRDAAGHTTVLTTSVYLHVAVEEDGRLGDLFGVRG